MMLPPKPRLLSVSEKATMEAGSVPLENAQPDSPPKVVNIPKLMVVPAEKNPALIGLEELGALGRPVSKATKFVGEVPRPKAVTAPASPLRNWIERYPLVGMTN